MESKQMVFPMHRVLKTLGIASTMLLMIGASQTRAAELRIGVTLHPYYSFVAHIVDDRAEIIPLIDSDSNPHGYAPQANDMIRITSMDVLIVNGIGHDSWAFEILDAAGMKDKLPLIYANDGVSLIPIAGDSSGEKIVNPHTFISTTAAIQQIYLIARSLGELDPDNAKFYRDNARQYALDIRKLRAEFDEKITGADLSKFRVATMHSGYDYILQELGLQVTAVIEPRHGVEPTARQLADTIDRINAAHVNVLFAEKYFASKLSDTIRDATGVEMYSISHISSGPYTPEKFIDEMRENLDTLAQAINDTANDRS
ncbi:MAG: ABC transporter substrate-binding protein [Gammaproteobacteria bacterium]|nr:MAG: ABC transporter substrate-binding protein [Gammaproteobacteria bacterium]